ncbi:MAG: hypothetical protein JWN52_1445, partial [Actinomycetia bacterium]|nr:hypothetical protein [Actinomycetes bacterium]
GIDLRAELTLSGDTDWPLVERIWATLVTLWSAVAGLINQYRHVV